MTVSELRVEIDTDGVGRIVLDRPHAKNALTIEMRDALIEAIRSVRSDPAVRALVITGEGDAFCAGMDLSASTVAQAGKPGFTTRSTSEALRGGVQTFIRELWELDKPTIAAVNGAAVGPGRAPRARVRLRDRASHDAVHLVVREMGARRRRRRRVPPPPPRRPAAGEGDGHARRGRDRRRGRRRWASHTSVSTTPTS